MELICSDLFANLGQLGFKFKDFDHLFVRVRTTSKILSDFLHVRHISVSNLKQQDSHCPTWDAVFLCGVECYL